MLIITTIAATADALIHWLAHCPGIVDSRSALWSGGDGLAVKKGLTPVLPGFNLCFSLNMSHC